MKRNTLGVAALLTAALALTACGQNTAPTAERPAADAASAPAASSVPSAAEPTSVHWSYEANTGPDHWAELESGFATCKIGQSQSPINIDHTKIAKSGEVNPVETHYGKLANSTIVDNGHTIQVTPTDSSAYMLLNGEKYTLLQFHFHHPSEHQIDGKNAEMELHFVHENAQGEKAVVGVLIQPGQVNPMIEQLWSHLPDPNNEEGETLDTPIDLNALLPKDMHAVHYDGSLTTPPCTEHVNWSVLEEPIKLSQQQIDLFSSRFPDNHRPIQDLGDRVLNGED